MRWAHAAVLAAVPSLIASLSACGSTVESNTTDATSSSSSTASSMNTGGAGQGGADTGGSSNGGAPSTGGSSANGGSGGTVMYPAPHPAPPTVVDLGGPIVSSPKVVPIFFSNDDPNFIPQIQDFLSKIQTSTYFPTAGAEYGVGAATVLPAIMLPDTANGTISDDEIQAWLVSKIEAGDGVFPAADGNTIYTIFYPSNVTITDFGGTSCQSFGGYHFNTHLHDGTPAVYAVIPRCPGGQGESALDLITSSTSHELLEASTDPQPYDNTAYGQLDDDHFSWELVIGAEIGDLCAFSPTGFSQYPDMPYLVQRVYSNTQALAGHDPCIPSTPHAVYFNSAPVLNDDITLSDPSGSVTMKGVKIGVGETATIDVDLFSDGPTDAWQVQAYDGNSLFGGSPNLEMSFDKDSGKNGDKLKLKIKVLQQGQYGLESFILYSIQGNTANVWAGVVGQH